MRILQKMLMDESINVNDTLKFTFRGRVFRARVDDMGFIVVGTRVYHTLSKWTRGEIHRVFGVSPRFSAWLHVCHVELDVRLEELRMPPRLGGGFESLVTAYFSPRVDVGIMV